MFLAYLIVPNRHTRQRYKSCRTIVIGPDAGQCTLRNGTAEPGTSVVGSMPFQRSA